MNHNSNTPSDKLGKEIVIHFFSECEKCKLKLIKKKINLNLFLFSYS